MTGDASPEGSDQPALADYLTRLEQLIAASTSLEPGIDQAAALAELQRVSASALRAAVAGARGQGVTWRELAKGVGMPAMTLHGQFRSGRGVIAVGNSTTEPPKQAARKPGAATQKRYVCPPPRDRFIGRERELTELRGVLAKNRMVTLVGCAGVGKSRLAGEFLRAIAGRGYGGGVWWVDLAPLADGSQVTEAVNAAIRDGRNGWKPINEDRGNALLVLDSCEHLVDDCAELLEQLSDSHPQLHVLATSREALRTLGEVIFSIEPLLAAAPPTADPRAVDAVRLFVDRARSAVPTWELTDELVPVVAELCRRLDGLPLAVELAARQIGVLPPNSLLEQADQRLDLLAGGARTAPERHQSLRAAIEWSYDLLSPLGQEVFRRVAILPGAFDMHAATAVCADLGTGPDELWPVLTDLAAKSLLVARPGTATRFMLLESLRKLGRERLADEHELPGAHERLLAWLTALAEGWLFDGDENPSQIYEEQHLLHYAVTVAEELKDARFPLLALALASWWRRQGDFQQTRQLIDRIMPTLPEDSPIRARGLIELARGLEIRGDYVEAELHAKESLTLSSRLGQPTLVVRALMALSSAYRGLENAASALDVDVRAVELLRALDRQSMLASTLALVAWDLVLLRRYADAQSTVDEVLALLEGNPEEATLAAVTHTAGTIALMRNQLDEAAKQFTRSLTATMLDADSPPEALEGLAAVAARSGHAERALRLFAAAKATKQAINAVTEPWSARLMAEETATARSLLPESKVVRAQAEGTALTAEQAIEYALHDTLPTVPAWDSEQVLTPREHQVADLVAQGLTNKQIAVRLAISPRTVVSHLEHIRTKLDLPTRAHITAWVTRMRFETVHSRA
ncbi:LuxR C-terminal-related transcriptional regulator [Amycolatopsis sp. cg5]|uniref:ATP-binding protein n=1 Tax=Amycolatopsis sp. cg5 TaxID=3238802 RepID=UPI00352649A1